MLKINCTEVKSQIDSLTALFQELDEIELNIFNQLKDACINWQDGYSTAFDEKVYLDKEESDLLLQFLLDKKDVLNFLYDKYSDIGKEIKCNLNSRDVLVNLISNCENQLNSILKEFEKIDTSYSELYSINKQKSKLLTVKSELSEIKGVVIKTYDRIEKIEEEVKMKLDNLSGIKINDFEFYLG